MQSQITVPTLYKMKGKGDKIIAVGQTSKMKRLFHAEKIIEAKGKAVIPGLINGHTHMFQSLLRGLGVDLNLHEWHRAVLIPAKKVFTKDDIQVGALLSCLEMIKTGTTCAVDNHYLKAYLETMDKIAKVVTRSGMRCFMASSFDSTERHHQTHHPRPPPSDNSGDNHSYNSSI